MGFPSEEVELIVRGVSSIFLRLSRVSVVEVVVVSAVAIVSKEGEAGC